MSIQDQILRAIDAAAERVIEVSRQIHDHPEPRFQEHFAANTLTGALEPFGITAQTPTGGLETDFRAEFGHEARPKVAILAEYDALPNGHACGHNLIAGAALGATVGLAAVRDQLPGQVVLLGTPGEEGGGGKVILIDNVRLHLRDGTRIHGIITDGGKAVNIIPQTAEAMFSVRALKADYLPVVSERVVKCAEAAALATGTQVEIKVQRGYKDMRDNMTMARRFGEYLRPLGVEFEEKDPTAGAASTDMGDVSYAVPSIPTWPFATSASRCVIRTPS